MAAYVADNLLADVKRDSYLAASQGNWSDVQILAIASDMVTRRMAPMLWSLKQGYFRESIDQVLVLGQDHYPMPRMCMWNKLHFVAMLDSKGNILSNFPIRVEPLELQFHHSTTAGKPRVIYYEATQFVVDPIPDATAASSYSLRLWHARRPGRLVVQAQAATVLSVNTGTGVVTYTAAPPVAFGAATTHDAYLSASPFTRRNKVALTAIGAAGSTQTFSVADAALIQVGDTVNMLDETIYPPVPTEIAPHLVELTIARIAKAKGDRQAFEDAAQEIMKDAQSVMITMAERDEGRPKKISLLHSPFLLRANRRGLPSTSN